MGLHLDGGRPGVVIEDTGLLAAPLADAHRLWATLIIHQDITDRLATSLILTVAADGLATAPTRILVRVVAAPLVIFDALRHLVRGWGLAACGLIIKAKDAITFPCRWRERLDHSTSSAVLTTLHDVLLHH